MSKKTITLINKSPLSVNRHYKVPWEDFIIKYKQGRKTIIWITTVSGIIGIKDIIEFNKNLIKDGSFQKNPEFTKSCREYNDTKELFLSAFENGEQFAFCPDEDELHINAPYINQALVEQAVAWHLKKIGVLKSEPRFRWKKYYGIYAIPA